MNPAQIHLALDHFPIAGGFLALFFLVWGLISKKDDIKLAASALIIISAVAAIPLFFSGEGAEEIVEHKPLVTKALIHEHEEAAEAAMGFLQLTAVLAVAWVVMKKKNIGPEKAVYASLIGLIAITSILMARAAHFGGQIRHEEIRNNAVLIAEPVDNSAATHDKD